MRLSTGIGLACERSFTYTIYMTREQYIKILQRELERINREIDIKIIAGEVYAKQAREHKILLRKIHNHYHKSSFKGIINKLFTRPKFQF